MQKGAGIKRSKTQGSETRRAPTLQMEEAKEIMNKP